MAINPTEEDTLDTSTEATEVVNVLKSATNILGLNDSGITFFPGDDEGMVTCDVCFALFLKNDPTLTGKDPFFIYHTNTSSYLLTYFRPRLESRDPHIWLQTSRSFIHDSRSVVDNNLVSRSSVSTKVAFGLPGPIVPCFGCHSIVL